MYPRHSVIANDPLFKQQWGLAATDVPNVWRFTTGTSKVLLVSLDSGLPTSTLASAVSPLLADDLDDTGRLNASDPKAISTTLFTKYALCTGTRRSASCPPR